MLSAAVEQALNLPPDEAASQLSTLPETQWFERKSGSVKPIDLAKTLTAFANSEGGVIAVGLANGAVSPVSDQANNDLRQAPIDFTRPPVRTQIQELMTTRGRVLIFRVGLNDHVHETSKGECYQRIGDESRRLNFQQRQELEWDRGAANFEGTAMSFLSSTDINVTALNSEKIHTYQQILGSASPKLALAARDLLTSHGEITVAAYLLFASRPQLYFPSAFVRVLRYSENERGAGRMQSLVEGADIRCEGPLVDQITEATEVVTQLIPTRRALGDSGRFEGIPIIPKDAWLEGIVNAVVHRSYSIAGDHIRVEIFPNRIEITSPGRFPGAVDPTHPESISRHARNPRIARVCSDMGITQELGEGIRRIFSEMRRVGLSDPLYEQRPEAVRLTLLASNAIPETIMESLGDGATKIMDALRLAQRPLGTGQIIDLVDITRPTALRHLAQLRNAGLIVWEGASPTDPRATWRLS